MYDENVGEVTLPDPLNHSQFSDVELAARQLDVVAEILKRTEALLQRAGRDTALSDVGVMQMLGEDVRSTLR